MKIKIGRNKARRKAGFFLALALLFASPASAQTSGEVANHAIPIGRGPGVVGFGAAVPGTSGQPLLSTGATTDPAFGGPTTLTGTIASGASALGTGAIASATCAAAVTTSATGTATTDVVTASFNGDPSAVTGYIPTTAGMLTILVYPTANNVNFKVCNNTASSITPGAITLNWRVVR